MAAKKGEIIEVSFRQERETKKMIRFEEIVAPGSEELTGSKIYMWKTTCAKLGLSPTMTDPPGVIHVRIESGP
jgi:hypothetical protein